MSNSKKILLQSFMALSMIAFPHISTANETTTCIGVGGLIFEKNDTIIMMSEDLLISPNQIRVEYTYLNKKDTDQELLVAFPLPNIEDINKWAFLDESSFDFLNFRTWINGQEISWLPFELNRKVYTELSSDLNTKKFNPYISRAGCAGDGITSKEDEYLSFVRTQIFPANKIVKVVHQYTPALGAGHDDDLSYLKNGILNRNCIDRENTLQTFNKWEKFIQDYDYGKFYTGVSERQIGYILHTAKNWSGPVQRFRLEITAPGPPYILITCFKGLKRVAENSYVFEATDYVPDTDINVVFLHLNLMKQLRNWPPMDQDDLFRLALKWAPIYELRSLHSTQDLHLLKKNQLRLLRNSIYARHGYVFDSSDLTDYFSWFSWYQPQTKNVKLSVSEKENVRWIEKLEASK